MRKFNVGDKVKVEKFGLQETIILDKKYIWIFTEYAVAVKYASYNECEKIHLEWFFKGDLCKSN